MSRTEVLKDFRTTTHSYSIWNFHGIFHAGYYCINPATGRTWQRYIELKDGHDVFVAIIPGKDALAPSLGPVRPMSEFADVTIGRTRTGFSTEAMARGAINTHIERSKRSAGMSANFSAAYGAQDSASDKPVFDSQDIPFRLTLEHPEQRPNEIFMGNTTAADFRKCGWNVKRMGQRAYDRNGKRIGPAQDTDSRSISAHSRLFPFFIEAEQVRVKIRELLLTTPDHTRDRHIATLRDMLVLGSRMGNWPTVNQLSETSDAGKAWAELKNKPATEATGSGA